MAYNNTAKNDLRDLIESELILKFGTPDVPTQLEDYSDAVAIALAKFFESIGYFPTDLDPYP